MKKSGYLLIDMAIIVVVVLLSGCLNHGESPSPNVDIKNGSFQPGFISVPSGTTVTWNNHNGTTETVTANDGSFDSQDLADGYEFRYTFLVPGNVSYYSRNNPSMKGTVEVTSLAPQSGKVPPSSAGTQAATPELPSTTINLVAHNIAFNTSTITVPAGAEVTVNFDNQDANIPHNFAVYETQAAQKAIFQGKIITGPAKTTYTFKAPDKPGTYFFRCDVHPTIMKGQFVVTAPNLSGETAPTGAAVPQQQATNVALPQGSSIASNALSATAASPATSVIINLTAKNIAFNTRTITVPAGADVTINFDNQDSNIPHNFAVYETQAAQKAIFQGKIITGPAKTTYTFKAPVTPGTYFFRCDVHPTIMKGQFIVTSSGASSGATVPASAAQPSISTTQTTPSQGDTSSSVMAGMNMQAASPPQAVLVEIRNYAFNPDSITVPAGTTVTWRNFDAVQHTATSTTGKFDSGIIGPGKNYSYTFQDPGTYDYYCTIHPYMKAQVVVTPADNPQPAPAEVKSSQVGTTQSLSSNTLEVPISTTSPQPSTSVIIDLLAKDMSYDTDKITVIAGSRVYINFINLDVGVPHNFAVYTGSEATTDIFQGQIIIGPAKITYSFDAPVDTGTYFFRCDVHPKVMTGDFYVVSSDNLASNSAGTANKAQSVMSMPGMSPPATSGAGIQNKSSTASQSVTVELTAENIAFDKNAITVPSGADVTVDFENKDSGVPHNFAVYDTDAAKNVIFQGKIITGLAKTTYTFKAPDKPGTYFFRCDVHPTQMKGQFIVV